MCSCACMHACVRAIQNETSTVEKIPVKNLPYRSSKVGLAKGNPWLGVHLQGNLKGKAPQKRGSSKRGGLLLGCSLIRVHIFHQGIFSSRFALYPTPQICHFLSVAVRHWEPQQLLGACVQHLDPSCPEASTSSLHSSVSVHDTSPLSLLSTIAAQQRFIKCNWCHDRESQSACIEIVEIFLKCYSSS